jgi:hypothetical protein
MPISALTTNNRVSVNAALPDRTHRSRPPSTRLLRMPSAEPKTGTNTHCTVRRVTSISLSAKFIAAAQDAPTSWPVVSWTVQSVLFAVHPERDWPLLQGAVVSDSCAWSLPQFPLRIQSFWPRLSAVSCGALARSCFRPVTGSSAALRSSPHS